MNVAVAAVVEFVESAAVGGICTQPLTFLVELLTEVRDRLPDIGIAPKALLLHAIDSPMFDARSPLFTPLHAWLEVGTRRRAHAPIQSFYSDLRPLHHDSCCAAVLLDPLTDDCWMS